MDQVSSFLENILASETTEQELEDVINEEIDVVPNNDSKKRMSIASNQSTNSNKYNNEVINIKSIDHSNPKNLKDISSFWYLNSNDEPKNSVMTDKLMEKVISMIIPLTTEKDKVIDDRIIMQQQRPPLSINIMSRNSIQLNQRLSAIFQFIDNVIKFISWYNPYFTIGILLIITHLILKPYLLITLPIFLVMNNILIPNYLNLYPPDKSMIDGSFHQSNPRPYEGGSPLNKYKIPKPIPEFSREFVLNLTDLQNHMILYIKTYDFIIWLFTDYLFFKDENITCLIYLSLIFLSLYSIFILPSILPVIIQYLPIKFMLIVNLWAFVGICHPYFHDFILDFIYDENTRMKTLEIVCKFENFGLKFISDYDQFEETRWVEIFELQKLNSITKIWEKIGFVNDFYTINNPIRKLNKNLFEEYLQENNDLKLSQENESEEEDAQDAMLIKIKQQNQLKDIKAPIDWEFDENLPWQLDLNVNDWVEEKLIQDIVNIDDDEKWVYDFMNIDPNDRSNQLFRRRRWIRNCKRKSFKNIDPTYQTVNEVNENRQSIYSTERLSKSFSSFLM